MLSLVFVASTIFPIEFDLLWQSHHRNPWVRHQFQRSHPCPSTGKRYGACPGYVVDHIEALTCGGPDKVSNMQWQTIQEAKAKDKRERKHCSD
jgi:hypothetical protein